MANSDKVLDRYEHPRNPGALDLADPNVGTAVVEAPACGDVIRLQIKVNDLGFIQDACSKTYGCSFALACSSLVTRWVKGKTLDAALAINSGQITQELALPPAQIHCSVLAVDAIKMAVADYRVRHPAGDNNPFVSDYDPLVP